MNVSLKRVDDAFKLEAKGSGPYPVYIDGAVKIGGHNEGVRSMELLLMGLGGCSSIDILSILKKMQQEVKDYNVEIEANRYEGEIPSLFENIHVKFILSGKLDESKVKRAVDLSMTKYCSATAILRKSANITYSFEIVNQA